MSTKTTVLISGGNQGIGYEIVKKLAHEHPGFHILLGSRDLQRGQEATSTLADLPGHVEAVQLDVTSDESIQACVDYITSSFGYLDVLISNAGMAGKGVAHESTLRGKYTAMFATNTIGAAILAEKCIPALRHSPTGHPRIIFVSSEMGSISNTLDPAFPYYGMDIPEYKASKAALNQIAAVLAVRLGKDGFKVNVCCPGLRRTNLNNYAERGGDAAEGALEACRLATRKGDEGDNGTFTNLAGKMPW